MGRTRLLIVESDPEIAACLRALLRVEGYATGAALDEGEALPAIAADPPAAVLLGPGVSSARGRALQQRIQRIQWNLPVVSLNAADGGRASDDSFDLAALVQAVARLALAGSGT